MPPIPVKPADHAPIYSSAAAEGVGPAEPMGHGSRASLVRFDSAQEPEVAGESNPRTMFAPLAALVNPGSHKAAHALPIPLGNLPPLPAGLSADAASTPLYLRSARDPSVVLKDPVLLANGDTIERSELHAGEAHGDNLVLRGAIEARNAAIDAVAKGAPMDDSWRTGVVDQIDTEPYTLPVQILSTFKKTNTDAQGIIRVEGTTQEHYTYEAAPLRAWLQARGTSPISKFAPAEGLVVAPNYAVQALCADGQVSAQEREQLANEAASIASMLLPRRRGLFIINTVPLSGVEIARARGRVVLAGSVATLMGTSFSALVVGMASGGHLGAAIGAASASLTVGLGWTAYQTHRLNGSLSAMRLHVAAAATNSTAQDIV